MMKLFHCKKCNVRKKHYLPDGSTRQPKCAKCGSAEDYTPAIGTFTMQVNYKTMEEIQEYEIDPFVNDALAKIGKEMVDGDVKTLENLVGESALKQTFHENDSWMDEQSIIDLNNFE